MQHAHTRQRGENDDGDGKTDLAVFRPSTGQWIISRSRTGSSGQVGWGSSSDVPAPGDYDGDGIADDLELTSTCTNPKLADTDGGGVDEGKMTHQQQGCLQRIEEL